MVSLVALAAWPVAAQRRGASVPWVLRPAVAAGVSAVLLGALLWFGAELVAGGPAGLAERVLGGMQALWPLLVALSCYRGQPPARCMRAGQPVVDGTGPRRGHHGLRTVASAGPAELD